MRDWPLRPLKLDGAACGHRAGVLGGLGVAVADDVGRLVVCHGDEPVVQVLRGPAGDIGMGVLLQVAELEAVVPLAVRHEGIDDAVGGGGGGQAAEGCELGGEVNGGSWGGWVWKFGVKNGYTGFIQ